MRIFLAMAMGETLLAALMVSSALAGKRGEGQSRERKYERDHSHQRSVDVAEPRRFVGRSALSKK